MGRLLFAACLAAVLAHPVEGGAQTYPVKPVRMIVPFPPGGTTDVAARILGDKLAAEWKQPVVVESRLGAGTTIAAAFVASAPPDGYLLYLTSVVTQASTGALYKNLGYDPLNGFTPIAAVTTAPFVLVTGPSARAGTVKELVALARAKPGQLTLATSGNGGAPHLVSELFSQATGIRGVYVPTRASHRRRPPWSPGRSTSWSRMFR